MQRKKLALVALALIFCISTASAALVFYLSNSVYMYASVTSPVELKLYDPEGTQITSEFYLGGGQSIDFFKIAYNNGQSGVPFAIVLVFKGTNGAGVIVDSAGPKDGQKWAIGNHLWTNVGGSIWNRDDLWWQIDGQAWYLHDAYTKYNQYYNPATWTLWGNPQNTKYDDGGTVKIDGIDYYVVVFGGTIGAKPADGAISAGETITNWGWGTPTGYSERAEDTPLVMPGQSYDVGKVKIIFAPNFVGVVEAKMQVVTPGYTIQDIVLGMFP